MRYPFAGFIIAGLIDVAGAQELPPTSLVPVALSEQKTQVWRLYNLNPDFGIQHLSRKLAKVSMQHPTDRRAFDILYLTGRLQGH
jgi:hypothetical protein